MRTFWFSALQAAFSGQKTAQEAMDFFVEEANKTLTPQQ
jgi:ABC-type glycerol-3-phosphate transport system substrate-binding protein